MKKTRLVCVGACAVDNILTVPHFPEEDSKLRATSFSKRRGGNSPNTLEVLQQLIENPHEIGNSTEENFDTSTKNAVPELFLVATLPARSSAQVAFIVSSFNHPQPSSTTSTAEDTSNSAASLHGSKIDLSRCVYREDYTEPVSSYIISSQSTSSRTIINNNVLPEMTFEEFVYLSHDLCSPSITPGSEPVDQLWFHFEGRITETTLECIRYLRSHVVSKLVDANANFQPQLKISVELEKPAREGLLLLAQEADVVFYSKAWARGEGYQTAEECLNAQAEILSTTKGQQETNGKTLICAWGEQGASALILPASGLLSRQRDATRTEESAIIHKPAYISPDRPIVDSTGAGDTFVAGVLFGFICRGAEVKVDPKSTVWSLRQTLSFATGLASHKILQDGFQGLGELSRALEKAVDLDKA